MPIRTSVLDSFVSLPLHHHAENDMKQAYDYLRKPTIFVHHHPSCMVESYPSGPPARKKRRQHEPSHISIKQQYSGQTAMSRIQDIHYPYSQLASLLNWESAVALSTAVVPPGRVEPPMNQSKDSSWLVMPSLVDKQYLMERIPPISQSKRKQVHFATTAVVHYRPLYSMEDRVNSWYNRDEYVAFDQDRRDTIRAIQSSENGTGNHRNQSRRGTDDQDYIMNHVDETICVEGLEQQLSRTQSLKRRLYSMQHVHMVLDCQQYQRSTGVNDPSSIVQIASEASSIRAKNLARHRAILLSSH